VHTFVPRRGAAGEYRLSSLSKPGILAFGGSPDHARQVLLRARDRAFLELAAQLEALGRHVPSVWYEELTP
jgi:hypothetical protein